MIKQSMVQLRRLLGPSRPNRALPLSVLMVCKEHERTEISKKAIVQQVGCDPNRVQVWRCAYIEGRLGKVLSHAMSGDHSGLIGADEVWCCARRSTMRATGNGLS